MFITEPEILYVDNHLLAVRKPAGMLVQGDATGDLDLLSWGKDWVKREYDKPGNVFLGLVQRLDRPVSGVVVFARTSKAASRLSASFRERSVRKVYWALAVGKTPERATLKDFVKRDHARSRIGTEADGLHAALAYRRLAYAEGVSWIEVELETGRHHQIRLQLAEAGHPLLGDLKYGSKLPFGGMLALHARILAVPHPVQEKLCTFQAGVDPMWKKTAAFQEAPAEFTAGGE